MGPIKEGEAPPYPSPEWTEWMRKRLPEERRKREQEMEQERTQTPPQSPPKKEGE